MIMRVVFASGSNSIGCRFSIGGKCWLSEIHAARDMESVLTAVSAGARRRGQKPRGMHWRTSERLREQAHAADADADGLLAGIDART